MWKSNLPFIINYENIVSIMWLKVDYDIKREREGVGGGGGGEVKCIIIMEKMSKCLKPVTLINFLWFFIFFTKVFLKVS